MAPSWGWGSFVESQKTKTKVFESIKTYLSRGGIILILPKFTTDTSHQFTKPTTYLSHKSPNFSVFV